MLPMIFGSEKIMVSRKKHAHWWLNIDPRLALFKIFRTCEKPCINLVSKSEWYGARCLEHFSKSEKSLNSAVFGQCQPNKEPFSINLNFRSIWWLYWFSMLIKKMRHRYSWYVGQFKKNYVLKSFTMKIDKKLLDKEITFALVIATADCWFNLKHIVRFP